MTGINRTPRKPRRAPVKGAARVALAMDLQGKYYALQSIRSIAAETGYSYGAVHSMLSLVNTELRNRGGRPRRRQAAAGQETAS